MTTQQTSIFTKQTPALSTPAPLPIPALPPPTPVLAPAQALPATSPTIFQPYCSTRSNFGQPPELLDRSGNVITQYTEATDPLFAPLNTSLVQCYCSTMDIRLPSRRISRTPSKEGPKRLLYNIEDGHAKIQRSRPNSLYLASLNWSKLFNVMDSGLITLSAFSAELLRDSELSGNGNLLLNYLNIALFTVLLNNDDNSTLTEAVNGPDSTECMLAMEKRN